MFVVIEGPDGCGKHTQASLLASKLESLGRRPRLRSFPQYETPVGQVVKKVLTGDILGNWSDGEKALIVQSLMFTDQSSSFSYGDDFIQMMDGKTDVIYDRHWPSGYAYGAADGLDKSWLIGLSTAMPKADFYFLLACPVDEAMRRIALRGRETDSYERDRAKQIAVRAHYEDLWTRNRGKGWYIVDASGPAGDVHLQIWNVIKNRLGVK